MRRPCNTFCLGTPFRTRPREALKSCSTPAEAKEIVAALEQTEAIQSITKWLNAIVAPGSVQLYIYNEILAALGSEIYVTKWRASHARARPVILWIPPEIGRPDGRNHTGEEWRVEGEVTEHIEGWRATRGVER